MKVLLLSRYSRLGASSRVRSYQYLPFLKERGFEIEVAPLFGDDYIQNLYSGRPTDWAAVIKAYFKRLCLLLRCCKYDLVWIEKEIFPWFPPWAEKLLAFFKIPFVADYDDAVYHRYDLNRGKLVQDCLGSKIQTVMRQAALVTVGNEYLGEYALKAGANRLEYLPTVVDLNRYYAVPSRISDVFTIGWIGTPGTDHYLLPLEKVFAEFCKDIPCRIVLVGAGPVKMAGVPIELRPWSEETEVSEIQEFDIGIMPLPDSPWERGKCGYKLVQYMACGRPVVASPVGINRQIVENGVNGFLASTTEEWIRAFRTLYHSNGLWEEMGRNGRQKAEREYSLQVNGFKLASMLESIVKEL